jgi:hypothetical protein
MLLTPSAEPGRRLLPLKTTAEYGAGRWPWDVVALGCLGSTLACVAGEGTFGELLRRYRRRAGFSQEELAARSYVSVRAVSDLEPGSCPLPTVVRHPNHTSGPTSLDAVDARHGQIVADKAGKTRGHVKMIWPPAALS